MIPRLSTVNQPLIETVKSFWPVILSSELGGALHLGSQISIPKFSGWLGLLGQRLYWWLHRTPISSTFATYCHGGRRALIFSSNNGWDRHLILDEARFAISQTNSLFLRLDAHCWLTACCDWAAKRNTLRSPLRGRSSHSIPSQGSLQSRNNTTPRQCERRSVHRLSQVSQRYPPAAGWLLAVLGPARLLIRKQHRRVRR